MQPYGAIPQVILTDVPLICLRTSLFDRGCSLRHLSLGIAAFAASAKPVPNIFSHGVLLSTMPGFVSAFVPSSSPKPSSRLVPTTPVLRVSYIRSVSYTVQLEIAPPGRPRSLFLGLCGQSTPLPVLTLTTTMSIFPFRTTREIRMTFLS